MRSKTLLRHSCELHSRPVVPGLKTNAAGMRRRHVWHLKLLTLT